MKSIIFIFLLFVNNIYSQVPSWQELPNSPIPSTSASVRFEDIYFVNANTGWTVDYAGKMYKTTDGGNNWSLQFTSPSFPNALFRSLGFTDELHGWLGTLDASKPLYYTTNGGVNWILFNSFNGLSPAGVCGINVVNSAFIYGCGVWSGTPRLIKTTNGGLNWTGISLSNYAKRLIDCYFWSQDSGLVVGSAGGNDSAAIFFTSDGGLNWIKRFSERFQGTSWGWKISFANTNTAYVSIEASTNVIPAKFFKTTDKGLTWVTKTFTQTYYDEEGIGFINSSTGWIGGWTTPTYETTNGGDEWHSVNWGYRINRFRILSDTLGYACGYRVYKFTRQVVGINTHQNSIPDLFVLTQNYPNPFNPVTTIKYEIPQNSFVTLKIYNPLGEELTTPVNQKQEAGSHEINFDGSNYPSGVYFYKLTVGEQSIEKKMVLIK